MTSEAFAVSPKAYSLIENLPLPITNSMVMSWVISVMVILGIRQLAGKPSLLPSRGQLFVESGVQGVRDIIEPIVGKSMVKPTFPFLLGLFFFILFHNLSGLLPGVGVFGFVDDHGHLNYWMRPGNADLNMTLMLGILASILGWGYFVIRYAGFKVLFFDLFGNKADKKDVGTVMYFLLFPLFILVGLIEVFSISLRPVSLAVRLFGNVYGGETLISNITGMASWIVPIPFYFLEILIGVVQALVFTLLTAVYIGLICNHGDDHENAH